MVSVEVNIQRQGRTGADSRLSGDKGDDSKGSVRSDDDDEDERRIVTECHTTSGLKLERATKERGRVVPRSWTSVYL